MFTENILNLAPCSPESCRMSRGGKLLNYVSVTCEFKLIMRVFRHLNGSNCTRIRIKVYAGIDLGLFDLTQNVYVRILLIY